MHEKIANVEGCVARDQASFQCQTRKIVGTTRPMLDLAGSRLFRLRTSARGVILGLRSFASLGSYVSSKSQNPARGTIRKCILAI